VELQVPYGSRSGKESGDFALAWSTLDIAVDLGYSMTRIFTGCVPCEDALDHATPRNQPLLLQHHIPSIYSCLSSLISPLPHDGALDVAARVIWIDPWPALFRLAESHSVILPRGRNGLIPLAAVCQAIKVPIAPFSSLRTPCDAKTDPYFHFIQSDEHKLSIHDLSYQSRQSFD
jgi:hypothetical protein